MLEKRRERGDLIQWYKIDANIDKMTWYADVYADAYTSAYTYTSFRSNLDPITKASRAGHRERLCKEAKLKCVQIINYLANRVVSPWNKLDDTTVQRPTTNSFKTRADAERGLLNFDLIVKI